ncbi:MAG: GTPase domain-containing protein [Hydrogenothermaceae bacterium]
MGEIFIIYHGLGMAGKTTNLEFLASIFESMKIDRFHQSTIEGRTVYLDTLLMAIKIKGTDERLKIRIFSTPGQERFSIVRPWIFSNADGFVFVVDPTQPLDQNIQAFREIQEYQKPKVIQINKVDLVEDISKFRSIFSGLTTILASANKGVGVKDTFIAILKEVLDARESRR